MVGCKVWRYEWMTRKWRSKYIGCFEFVWTWVGDVEGGSGCGGYGVGRVVCLLIVKWE